MKSLLSRLSHFFRFEFWATGFKGHKQKDNGFQKCLKVLYMAMQGFHVDRCALNASALTYYSLLAIVPILALAFGIAKGFRIEDVIEQELLTRFSQYETVIAEAVRFANRILEQTRGGIIAAFGLALLLLAIVKVLNHMEDVFNRIWLTTKKRSYRQLFTDYLAIGIVSPALVLISNSAAVLLITETQEAISQVPVIGPYGVWISALISLVPILATTTLLAFLYLMIPTANVHVRTAVIAGFVTAVIYHSVQYLYIYFQVGIASYGALYGSFAAFPLFLIWIQISWMIVLFGAEISYSIQNLGIFGLKQMKRKISIADRKLLTLSIMHLLVKNFHARRSPLSDREISQKLEIPYQVSSQLLQTLIDCHLAVVAQDGKKGYQPAIATGDLRVADVIAMIEKEEEGTVVFKKNEELLSVQKILTDMDEAIRSSDRNILLKDL